MIEKNEAFRILNNYIEYADHCISVVPIAEDAEVFKTAIAALEFTYNLTEKIADLIVVSGCKDLDEFCERYGIPKHMREVVKNDK